MKRANLTSLTTDQLIGRFAEIGVAQDQALQNDDNAKYRRLFRQMDEVDNELRARGPDARLALLQLYDHPNMQVRLKAAKRSLGVAPEPARQVLQAISKAQWYPQSLDAGMTIFALDDGTFKPT